MPVTKAARHPTVDGAGRREAGRRRAPAPATSRRAPPRRGDALRSFATHRPVAVAMVFLALMVFGGSPTTGCRVTLMPELSYPDADGPHRVPRRRARGGRERHQPADRGGSSASSAACGGCPASRAPASSDVVLEFSWDTEMSDATQDTLEKLDLVFLPEEAERPLILHYDPSLDPVMELSLSGAGERFRGRGGAAAPAPPGRAAGQARARADQGRRGGAGARRPRGGDPRLARRGRAAPHRHLDPAGDRPPAPGEHQRRRRHAQGGPHRVHGAHAQRVPEPGARSPRPSSRPSRGATCACSDLGRGERAHKEREIVTRADGGESVQIEVFKEADANIVALAARGARGRWATSSRSGEGEAAEAGLRRGRGGATAARAGGPSRPGSRASSCATRARRSQVVADRSVFIQASIAELRDNAIVGGLLAVARALPLPARLPQPRRSSPSPSRSSLLDQLRAAQPLGRVAQHHVARRAGARRRHAGRLLDRRAGVDLALPRGRGRPRRRRRSAAPARCAAAVVSSTLTRSRCSSPWCSSRVSPARPSATSASPSWSRSSPRSCVALFLVPMLAQPPRRGRSRTPGCKHDAGAGACCAGRWRRGRRSGATCGGLRGVDLRRLADAPAARPSPARFAGLPLPDLPSGLRLALRGPRPPHARCSWSALARVCGLDDRRPLARGVMRAALAAAPSAASSGRAGRLRRAYPAAIRWAAAPPAAASSLATLAHDRRSPGSSRRGLGSELLPEVHQGEFTVEVALPVGTPLEETEAVPGAGRARDPRPSASTSRSLILTVGYDPANASAPTRASTPPASRSCSTAPTARRRGGGDRAAAHAPRRDPRPPGARRPPGAVQLPDADRGRGPRRRPAQLKAPGRAGARGRWRGCPSWPTSRRRCRRGAPEVQIVYDRDRLAALRPGPRRRRRAGARPGQGREATPLQPARPAGPDRRAPGGGDREAVEDVRGLRRQPRRRAADPARRRWPNVSLGEGPSEVRRVDGQRVGLVRANLAPGTLGAAALARRGAAAIDARSRTASSGRPTSASCSPARTQEWERSRGSLLARAGALGVPGLRDHGRAVRVAAPAAGHHADHPARASSARSLTLWLLGISLSIVVFLGMIMLAGIVVNNAIVLVDYINMLRAPRHVARRGDRHRRAGAAAADPDDHGARPCSAWCRWRSAWATGAEIRTPMAIAVISGLLTLDAADAVRHPVASTRWSIAWQARLARAAGRGCGRLSAPPPPGGLRGPGAETVPS